MTQVFATPGARKAFDGQVLLSLDGGATVWAFPMATIAVSDSDNVSRPDVIDANGAVHVEMPGVRSGSLDFVCPLMPDRAVHTFLTAAVGPRTNGQLTPFVANLIPYGGGDVQKFTGVWFSRISITARFSLGGQQSAVSLRASAMVFDIDNYFAAPTLVAPATAGKNGAGAASFSNCSFSDGAASSPTIYDEIRSFSWTADNGMTPDPSIIVPASRIAGGAVPSSLRGAVTLEQLTGPTNPLPAVRGNYPLSITIPTGDGTHALTLANAVSRDGSSLNLVPNDFIGRGQLYSLFGNQASNGTGSFLFVASYA